MSDYLQADPAAPTPSSGSVPGSEIVPSGRGCVSSVVSNGCGCMAFLVGAGLAVAFFGTHLLSGWGARAIEEYIGQYVNGTVEVTGVDLSWSRPQAASVVKIHSSEGEGELVLQAALKFPSLFDLFGDAEGERNVVVTIESLTSRIDEDGTSDLGRTFGLEAGDGPTVVQALRDHIEAFVSDRFDEAAESSLHFKLEILEANFYDRAQDRANVRIDSLILDVRSNRIAAQIDLSECDLVVGKHNLAVGFDVLFEYGDDGHLALKHAALEADPIPRSVLRTLGLVPRVDAPSLPPDRRRNRDVYDVFGEHLEHALSSFLGGGTRIKTSYSVPGEAEQEPQPGPGLPRFELHLSNAEGELDLYADLREGAFVPADLEGGGPALRIEFVRPLAAPASVLGAITPPGIVVHDDTPGLPWVLESRSFSVSLDESLRALGRVDGQRERTGPERAARWLRTAGAEISLRNAGGQASRVHFDGGESTGGSVDRLDWTHRLTMLTLMGELGGSLRSTWRTGQPDRASAHIELSLPGRALGPGDMPTAHIGASIPGLTVAFLDRSIEVPPLLRSLLPRRLHRLKVDGIPASRLMASTRRDDAAVEIGIWTGAGADFSGRFENGQFHVPSARFELVASSEAGVALLERTLPWLGAIEPLDATSELTVSLRDYSFTEGGGAYRESGQVVIEAPPLRVRLAPSLARNFEQGDAGGWIEWTPAPIELTLELNRVIYAGVELPLGDEVEPSVMTGDFDLRTRGLDLTGYVDAGSLSSQADAGAADAASGELLSADGILPVEINITGTPDALKVLVDQRFIESALTDMLNLVREGVTNSGG